MFEEIRQDQMKAATFIYRSASVRTRRASVNSEYTIAYVLGVENIASYEDLKRLCKIKRRLLSYLQCKFLAYSLQFSLLKYQRPLF
jgi:hypothetical protein